MNTKKILARGYFEFKGTGLIVAMAVMFFLALIQLILAVVNRNLAMVVWVFIFLMLGFVFIAIRSGNKKAIESNSLIIYEDSVDFQILENKTVMKKTIEFKDLRFWCENNILYINDFAIRGLTNLKEIVAILDAKKYKESNDKETSTNEIYRTENAEPLVNANKDETQSNNGLSMQLKQLKELKDEGLITNEEYEAKKKQLLGL